MKGKQKGIIRIVKLLRIQRTKIDFYYSSLSQWKHMYVGSLMLTRVLVELENANRSTLYKHVPCVWFWKILQIVWNSFRVKADCFVDSLCSVVHCVYVYLFCFVFLFIFCYFFIRMFLFNRPTQFSQNVPTYR